MNIRDQIAKVHLFRREGAVALFRLHHRNGMIAFTSRLYGEYSAPNCSIMNDSSRRDFVQRKNAITLKVSNPRASRKTMAVPKIASKIPV
jgi:hypothetical protein